MVRIHTQALSVGYLFHDILERHLNRLMGQDWSVEVKDGTYLLRGPRELTEDEIYDINLECRNRIRAQGYEKIIKNEPSTGDPEQTEPEQSAHQSWSSDLPCFGHNSEMVLAINMIPPSLSGKIQILDNFGRTCVTTRKTFQLWGDGLKNKLLARVLFSKESEIEVGQTAEVFSAMGNPTADQVIKTFAVKHIKDPIKAEEPSFRIEYQALRRANTLEHPNIIQTLAAFKSEKEERGVYYLNFVFPRALGNLKRLFRGDLDEMLELQGQPSASLWQQFAGLTSAVVYLHETMHTAHRDLKPSNILIYPKGSSGNMNELVLKITDFGLAVDLTKAGPSFERSSHALQSAWAYDAPGMHRGSRYIPEDESQSIEILSPTELRSNDIWKLGIVFVELIAFLATGGSKGISAFREQITTTQGKFHTNLLYGRFHDGERVKPEVLDWLTQVSQDNHHVDQLRPILQNMLGDGANRYTAREILSRLIKESSPIHMQLYEARLLRRSELISWTGITFFDGSRILGFTRGRDLAPLNRFDKARLTIQSWFREPIDWDPLPDIAPTCSPDDFLVSWQRSGKTLSIVLTKDHLQRYRATCLPRLWDMITSAFPPSRDTNNGNLPEDSERAPLPHQIPTHEGNDPGDEHLVLPFGNPGARPTPVDSDVGGMLERLFRRNQKSPPQPGPQDSQVDFWDIYCCINRMYTEPLETILRHIDHNGLDDEKFLVAFNKEIERAAGNWFWGTLRRLFSWKRCSSITFVEFRMRRQKDQVATVRDWQLPPPEKVTWQHAVKDPTDVRMVALSEEIVYGLKNPRSGRNDYVIISELPRKKHPRLPKTFGTQGWGLHATMGFSPRRFLWWIASCSALCAIYAVLWFHFVNDTQVTTALAPPGILLTLLTMALTVVQKTEDVWHPSNIRLLESSTAGTGTELPRASPLTDPDATVQEGSYPSSSTAPATTSIPESDPVPNFSRRRIRASENRA